MGFFDSKSKKKNLDFSEQAKVLDSLPTPPPLNIGVNKTGTLPAPPPLPESIKSSLQPIPMPPPGAMSAKPGFDAPFSIPPSQSKPFESAVSSAQLKPLEPFTTATMQPKPSPRDNQFPQKEMDRPIESYKQEPSQSLPSFAPLDKKIPQQLPSFTILPKQSRPLHMDVEVPTPPPNLRSEISPIELERLEEKYLDKRPKMSDMEEPYSYDHHKKVQKPLFVRTDYYRQMLNNFIDIKDTLTESEEIIYRLENLKKNADVEYSEFKRGIEEIQRKLIYVDKTLFEG
jgi:hypothetical protein